jgi:hypothetical protein
MRLPVERGALFGVQGRQLLELFREIARNLFRLLDPALGHQTQQERPGGG